MQLHMRGKDFSKLFILLSFTLGYDAYRLLDISLKARFATLIYHHRILNAVLST